MSDKDWTLNKEETFWIKEEMRRRRRADLSYNNLDDRLADGFEIQLIGGKHD